MFRFVVLLQHEPILFIVSNYVSNSRLYVSGKRAWFLLCIFYFFNPIAFKVSPWIPKSIWSVQAINHLFGTLIHRWFHDIQCQCMLPPVIVIFVVRATFFYARHISHECTSNAYVHSGWCGFFPLDTLQQNISRFYPTPTKTCKSKITLPHSQMWTCMIPTSSHLIPSIAHINCQTYWCPTKQYTFSGKKTPKTPVSYSGRKQGLYPQAFSFWLVH
jgi:hypothetical protein